MRLKNIIFLTILIIVGVPFCIFSEEINPESYRKDYYKMPPQNELQEKAMLRFKLNWEIPKINPEQPVVITDSDGNKYIYSGGKILYSFEEDGTLTYYLNGSKDGTLPFNLNGSKMFSREILDSGELYLFRNYNRKSNSEIQITNEFGETVGWEIMGLDNRVLQRFDSKRRLTFRLDFDGSDYWEQDLVDKTWTRLRNWIPEEERRDAKWGQLLARWERKATYYGRKGLWKIEKGLYDGENIVDMYYTWYGNIREVDLERYNKDGAMIARRDRMKGVTYDASLGSNNERLGYRRIGDFGARYDGYTDYDSYYNGTWEYEYKGSKLVSAKRSYEDEIYYDERIYDFDGNVDKVERKNKYTNEVLQVLDDNVYLWEVENMSVEQLKAYFKTTVEIANYVYEWVKEMKSKEKHSSTLVASLEFIGGKKLTLYNEYTKPVYTLSLIDYPEGYSELPPETWDIFSLNPLFKNILSKYGPTPIYTHFNY